jgi:hypothetical protein
VWAIADGQRAAKHIQAFLGTEQEHRRA